MGRAMMQKGTTGEPEEIVDHCYASFMEKHRVRCEV